MATIIHNKSDQTADTGIGIIIGIIIALIVVVLFFLFGLPLLQNHANKVDNTSQPSINVNITPPITGENQGS